MHDEIKCGNVVSRLFQMVNKDYKCPTLDHSVSELNKTNCGTFPLEKGSSSFSLSEDEECYCFCIEINFAKRHFGNFDD